MTSQSPASVPMPQPAAPRRHELDALRGLAALSVVLLHCISILAATPSAWFQRLDKSPLAVFWAGQQAVIFFFFLSGFVLWLMLERSSLSYASYVRRRFYRLYPPYIVSIGVALLAIVLFGSRKLPELGDWVNQYLGVSLEPRTLLGHVLLVGNFDTKPYNFVIWSMSQELRISLIFPLIVWVQRRIGWLRTLALFAGIDVIGTGAFHWLLRSSLSDYATYAVTLHYLFVFAAGAALAGTRHQWTAAWKGLSGGRGALLFGFAAVCVSVARIAAASGKVGLFGEWPVIPASAAAIVAATCTPSITRLLCSRPLAFLGRVSYSLYLYHGVLLLALLNALYPRLPLLGILALSIVGAVGAAAISYRTVEQPSIDLIARDRAREKGHAATEKESLRTAA